MTFNGLTVQAFLDALASPEPTPGGGTASAIAGAMGVSLLVMVTGLAKSKTNTDDEKAGDGTYTGTYRFDRKHDVGQWHVTVIAQEVSQAREDMTPEEAVQGFVEVRGGRLFPVHWGTFNLAFHAWDEPIRRAVAAAGALQVDIVTPRVGESVVAGEAFASSAWWEAVK